MCQSASINDLPDDLLKMIGVRLIDVQGAYELCAKDCAAVAMTSKSMSALSTTAWIMCARAAEHGKPLDEVRKQQRCKRNGVSTERYREKIQFEYMLARNHPDNVKKDSMAVHRALGSYMTVGSTCPIPFVAANYLLQRSLLRIPKSYLDLRDRDLSGIHCNADGEVRFRSVLSAPNTSPMTTTRNETIKTVIALRTARRKALYEVLNNVQKSEQILRTHGYERRWGDTNIDLCFDIVRLQKWGREQEFPEALLLSASIMLRYNPKALTDLKVIMKAAVDMLRSVDLEFTNERDTYYYPIFDRVYQIMSEGMQMKEFGKLYFKGSIDYRDRMRLGESVELCEKFKVNFKIAQRLIANTNVNELSRQQRDRQYIEVFIRGMMKRSIG